MKISHKEFLKKFGMNSGGHYWAGDRTVNLVIRLWQDYQEIRSETEEDFIEMVDVFAKHLEIPQQQPNRY